MRYRPDIDGLRAIAVIAVLLFHARISGFGGGFVGVDVFFVISGYLITNLIVGEIEQGSFSILSFYERRVRRIIPALFTVVACTTILAFIFFMPNEFTDFGKSTIAIVVFVVNYLFRNQAGYFDAPADLKPLLHTWSLAVEEQFYIAFPLLLMFIKRFLKARYTVPLLTLFIISLAISVWGVFHRPASAFYLLQSRAWELLLGALLAVGAVQASSNPTLREAGGFAGLMLIAYSVFSFSEHTPFPGFNALFPCLGAGLVIWSGGTSNTIVRRLLASRPLVGIGLISYSLYLWHWPALVFLRYILMRELMGAEIAALMLPITVLSFLSWRYIEMPIRRGTYWKGWRLLSATTATGAAIAAIGIGVVSSQGLPQRLDPEVAKILTSDYRHDRQQCHRVNTERVDAGKLCIMGAAEQQPSFVLVGDSHADALSPAVFLAAERLGLSGYQFTAFGFRPLPGVLDPIYRDNHELTVRFVEFLHQMSSVRLIILIGYWELQATGRSYRHSDQIFRDAGYDGSGIAYNKESFRRGLKKLLEAFPDRTFALLEDIPTGKALSLKLAARVAHTKRIKGLDQNHFALPRHQYEGQIATYRPILDSALEAGNAFVVPVIDILCNREFCNGSRNGVILFRDGDHLSAAGAMLFVDTLNNVLRRGLDKQLLNGERSEKDELRTFPTRRTR